MPRPLLRQADDEGDGDALARGSASPVDAEPQGDEARLVATLWLPSSEYRSGWNEWCVYAPPATPRRRRLGFRR